MSYAVVAKHDFRNAVRSKLLWAITALFVLLVGGLAYAYTALDLGSTAASGTIGFIIFLSSPASLFISIVGLLVGYKAIAGERESGTISFLLGLPHSRRDVVLGKVVGRAATLCAGLLLGFGIAVIVLFGFGESASPVEFGLFTLLTLLYAVTFVTIAVSLSSVTASSSRAGAAAVGLWIFNQFWGVLALALLVFTSGLTLPNPPYPDWFHAISGLSPGAAYGNAAGYFLPSEFTEQVQGQIGGLPEWYGLVVLVVWLAVPLAVAIYRFERIDL